MECGDGEQGAEADLLLQGSFHERRSHVVQIIFDLLGHMDGKPVEFIIKSLQDATEQLQDYKAENEQRVICSVCKETPRHATPYPSPNAASLTVLSVTRQVSRNSVTEQHICRCKD